jgi:hypothetical protein
MSVSVFGGANPVVEGTTNLPDGISVILTLSPPREPNAAQRLADGLSACISSFAPYQDKVAISHGKFVGGPFGDGPLRQGLYKLEVDTAMASSEPYTIKSVIGENGRNLRGPHVQEWGPPIGKTIHYVTRIRIP